MSPSLAGLLLAASSALSLRSSGVTDGKADFDAALKQVSKLMEDRKWKAAESHLRRQLTEHVGQGYVREQVTQIKDHLRRCAFEIEYPKGPGRALCGEVLSYDAKTGDIEVRYKRSDASAAAKSSQVEGSRDESFPCADFEMVGKEAVLKMPFVGPFSIELSGEAMEQLNPKVRVGIGQKGTYLVTYDFGNLSTIKLDDRTVVSSSTFGNVARPYKIEVDVRDKQLHASHNGTRIVHADKQEKIFGKVGFADFANLEEIRLNGKADRAWVEQRIEERARADFAEFEKTYDAEANLPEWLRTK